MIPDSSASGPGEVCSSPDHRSCPVAVERLGRMTDGERCPLLLESHAEYCAAAELVRFIPASNDMLSRCKSDGHLYCELYLVHADPQGERLPETSGRRRPAAVGDRTVRVDGMPVPTHLFYSPNHMWLDIADDGYCHVGVDAFLTSTLGSIDSIAFVTAPAIEQPCAVLRVNGVDLQLVFPRSLHRKVANGYLRTRPEKVTVDPYGAGWLFEGVEPVVPGKPRGEAIREGLLPGSYAPEWIREEQRRLTGFVHERLQTASDPALADGGEAVAGLAAQLDREGLILLFNEFFASGAETRRFR
jgi:glycine cleavage system H lipoate-binding protein